MELSNAAVSHFCFDLAWVILSAAGQSPLSPKRNGIFDGRRGGALIGFASEQVFGSVSQLFVPDLFTVEGQMATVAKRSIQLSYADDFAGATRYR